MYEENVATVGWVSLSKSGKSLSVKVQSQTYFVPLGDLYQVLDGKKNRADLKQWVERKE